MLKSVKMIKEVYGLISDPSIDKIKEWVVSSEKYMSSGVSAEKAGMISAILLFTDMGSTLRKTTMSVEELLELARSEL